MVSSDLPHLSVHPGFNWILRFCSIMLLLLMARESNFKALTRRISLHETQCLSSWNIYCKRMNLCNLSHMISLSYSAWWTLLILGYIGEFEEIDDHRSGKIVIQLNGRLNKCGVISPRFNVRLPELEKWVNQLLPARSIGYVVLTTSAGIMDYEEARRKHVSGKILGFFYWTKIVAMNRRQSLFQLQTLNMLRKSGCNRCLKKVVITCIDIAPGSSRDGRQIDRINNLWPLYPLSITFSIITKTSKIIPAPIRFCPCK